MLKTMDMLNVYTRAEFLYVQCGHCTFSLVAFARLAPRSSVLVFFNTSPSELIELILV